MTSLLPPLRPMKHDGYDIVVPMNAREMLYVTRRMRRMNQDAEGAVRNLLGTLERERAKKVTTEETIERLRAEFTAANPGRTAPFPPTYDSIGKGGKKRLIGFQPLPNDAPAAGGKRGFVYKVNLNDFERMALDRQQATSPVCYGLDDAAAIRALLAREEEELQALYVKWEETKVMLKNVVAGAQTFVTKKK